MARKVYNMVSQHFYRNTPEQDYNRFKFYIGVEHGDDKILSEQMLRKWSNDPNRRVECDYCGETYPAKDWSCLRCREYKGIVPYIPEWSNWG